tara:strand:+ start:223 stop:417 length:195 start_codon:yes stop_codon:yes gene_type:complete
MILKNQVTKEDLLRALEKYGKKGETFKEFMDRIDDETLFQIAFEKDGKKGETLTQFVDRIMEYE